VLIEECFPLKIFKSIQPECWTFCLLLSVDILWAEQYEKVFILAIKAISKTYNEKICRFSVLYIGCTALHPV